MRNAMYLLLASALWGSACAPPRQVKVDKGEVKDETPKTTEAPKKTETGESRRAGFVAAFLKSMSASEAKSTVMTEEFKKRIAPPRNEEERKSGYSESLAQAYLDRLVGGTWKSDAIYDQANGATVIGTITAAKTIYFVLKLQDDGTQAKVAWLHASPVRVGDRVTARPVGPDTEAARDFLEVAVGGDGLLAAALLASELKAALAPPHASDADLGYNRNALALKLKAWAGSAVTLVGTDEVGRFTGEVTRPDGKAAFSLKVGSYAGNRMLVESLEWK
jgi:hypothetical protein